jgi:G6PDH family F420-dependent oxidoreductase
MEGRGMVAFGYTLMCEQRGPRELVSDAVAAEQAGFDFEVISDHYFPWLNAQGHAPNAWAVLGAVATATRRVPLMTYVTCPIMRYHPAVVAQQAATVALLAGDDRFVLGLGAGENLNEHVVGRGWPPANVRHEMLTEAVGIISDLFDGGYVSTTGRHFRVDSAKLWDVPAGRVPIAVAVSGSQSVDTFAPIADAMVAVEPEPALVTGFDDAAGVQLPKIGQQPLSWWPDRDAAVATAHDQFRWFAGGWKVNAELPGTSAFAAATQFVRPDDVAEAIPCGPDVAAHVEAVRPFVDAGFTHVALVQIGGQTQAEFVSFAARELLPALREEYGKPDDVVVRPR